MLTNRLASQQPLEQRTIDGAQAATYEQGEALNVHRTRIYDQLDGSHRDVENHVLKHEMKKTVAHCSVCNWRNLGDDRGQNRVRAHIRAARESGISHRNAEAVPVITPEGSGNQCSGCGAKFLSRPSDIAAHIERAQKMGPLHEGATVLVKKEFDLMPPVLEKPEVTPVAVAEPDQVAPGGRRKPSRRRRRHGRRKESVA